METLVISTQHVNTLVTGIMLKEEHRGEGHGVRNGIQQVDRPAGGIIGLSYNSTATDLQPIKKNHEKGEK
jgi:hypothetical protein